MRLGLYAHADFWRSNGNLPYEIPTQIFCCSLLLKTLLALIVQPYKAALF